MPQATPFGVGVNQETGLVNSVQLYGEQLLDPDRPSNPPLLVNGLPLNSMRLYPRGPQDKHPLEHLTRLKGEKFVDHFSGAGLVLNRRMGVRQNPGRHNAFGVQYVLRREPADMTDLPTPGPGGPVVEAPLWIDTLTLGNWNWNFWGDQTRMIFSSTHSSGPAGEYGHVGYNHDTPEQVKKYLKNVWRRIYPGCMLIHGGLYYNARTGHWIAITCRKPNRGYILNIQDAGRGVCYDFTLHAHLPMNEHLHLPELRFYYGETRQQMMTWLADYATHYYQQPPAWFHKTLWNEGMNWSNRPTWVQQADHWEKQLDDGVANGVGIILACDRPIKSGTDPLGYHPDPFHGPREEFERAVRRIADRGVPMLLWMSHSGLRPGPQIDEDWFIRGIDGNLCASWGSEDGGMIHINPGHPGYIEYTKQYVRWWMNTCGGKGVFFDCYSWAFPPDFKPRDFMKYPGDTNLMGIRFMEEIYACVKACDPEGVVFGEGTSLEGPVSLFSISSNPINEPDGMGPRDFTLQLNRYAPDHKKMVICPGGRPLAPGSGMNSFDPRPGAQTRNRFYLDILQKYGKPGAFIPLPGDLSVLEQQKLLFVAPDDLKTWAKAGFSLPEPWDNVSRLEEVVDGNIVEKDADGRFVDVPAGIYTIR